MLDFLNPGQHTLGDCLDTTKGYAFKSKWYTDVGRQVVKVSDFTDNSVNTNNLVCIPEEIAARFLNNELISGNVVIQTVGSWPSNPASVVGKVIRVPRTANHTLLNQNAVKLTPRPGLNNNYLYYLLKDHKFKDYIIGTAQGAASQASITLASIRSFTFELPSIPSQRRIAAILSAYDDLIENNTRRIAILEEMARRLYEEWFVHFRFPGHEGVKMVESEIGPVPDGWKFDALGNLIEFKKGKKPKETCDAPSNGLVPQLLIGVLRGDVPAYADPANMINAEDEDTLMVMDGSGSGDIFIGASGVIGSTLGRYRVKPETGFSPYCLYLLFQFRQEEIKLKNVGTAIPHANKEYIARISVSVPDGYTSTKFDKYVSVFFSLREKFRQKNTNLRAQRDLLLPKLISGEIDVSEISEQMAEAAAE